MAENLEQLVRNLPFNKRIKIGYILTNKTNKDLFKSLKINLDSSITNRLKTDKFTIKERKSIGKALGAKFNCSINFSDGFEARGVSARALIEAALQHQKMTLTELSEKFGTYKQNFGLRLNRGKFTTSELRELARLMGGEYEDYFDLDGVKF